MVLLEFWRRITARTTTRKEWLKNQREVSYCGIYDKSKDLHAYEFLTSRDNLQAMIDLARSKDKQFDPMVWMVHTSKKYRCLITLYLFIGKFMILRMW